MSGGGRFCQAGQWTTLYEGPSFGFVYAWNLGAGTLSVRWRAYTASPFWYSDGSANLNGKTTVGFGIPTPYVKFQVNPPVNAQLFGS